MRTLSTNTGAAVAESVTKPGYLIEITFPVPVAPFRASSRGEGSWGGRFWRRFGFSIKGLASDTSRVSLEGQAIFQDPDNELGQLVGQFGIGDREINVWKFYGDDIDGLDADDPVHLGRMRGADCDEDCDTCVVSINMIMASVSTLYCPRTYLTPENGFNQMAEAGLVLEWKNERVALAESQPADPAFAHWFPGS